MCWLKTVGYKIFGLLANLQPNFLDICIIDPPRGAILHVNRQAISNRMMGERPSYDELVI